MKRHAQRTPRSTRGVTPVGPERPGQLRDYLSITGSARIVEGGAPQLLKQLAKVMLGSDEHFGPPNAPAGLLTRVRIEKIGDSGPWVSENRL